MSDKGTERLASVIGWLLVGIPTALLVLLAAWISSIKLGLTGGVAYSVGLVAWVSFLLWRWKRG